MFDGDRENYVEEEYDNDGVLIYEPSPLDEVWLSEPERRDRQDALRRQCRITKRREELKSKEIKQQVKCEPMPALAEFDIDSDDDSQPDNYEDDAVFESRGWGRGRQGSLNRSSYSETRSSPFSRASRTSRGSSRGRR